MTAIKTNFGSGGANITPGHGDPDAATTLREIAEDLAELRTQFIAALAKLDGDAGVNDTDYESGLTPAAMKTTKG